MSLCVSCLAIKFTGSGGLYREYYNKICNKITVKNKS